MDCHHKISKELGGSDEYKNLIWLTYDKVNSLRKLVGNSII